MQPAQGSWKLTTKEEAESGEGIHARFTHRKTQAIRY